jgi:hypothetical protein
VAAVNADELMLGSAGADSAEKLSVADLAGNDLGRASDVLPQATKVSIDVAQRRAISKFGKTLTWEGRTIELLDPGDRRAQALASLSEGQVAIIDPQAFAGTPWEKTLVNNPIVITEDFLTTPPSKRPKVDLFANAKPAPESDETGRAVLEWMKDPLKKPVPLTLQGQGKAPLQTTLRPEDQEKKDTFVLDPRGSADTVGGVPYKPSPSGTRKRDESAGIANYDGFSPQLSLVGIGDFDANSSKDLLLRNEQTGEITIWYMNGTQKTGEAPLMGLVATPDYIIEGVGDFDGNGRVDIAFRQNNGGNVAIWFLGGTFGNEIVNTQFVNSLMPLPAGWQADAVADFNNDGKADWLWRYQPSGAAVIHYMNGSTIIGSTPFITVTDTNWKIVGAGDINGDNVQDVFWRNSVSGANQYWLMNSGYQTTLGQAGLASVSDLNWKIETVGDINGDNRPDLIWEYPGVVQSSWLSSPSSGNLPSPSNPSYLPSNITASGTNNNFIGNGSGGYNFGYHQRFGAGLIDVAAAIASLTGQAVAPEQPDSIAINPSQSTTMNNGRQNELVNMPEVWNQGYTGQGITVAVLDSGIYINHPDLNDNIDFVNSRDFFNNDSDPSPTSATETHGTWVAGVVAAEADPANAIIKVRGGASSAKIMALRVGDSAGVDLNIVDDALIYAADKGARVINMSFSALTSDIPLAIRQNIESAVNYAVSKGAVVVVSAGNIPSQSVSQRFPASLATLPGVIVVGAVRTGVLQSIPNVNEVLQVAAFSTAAGSSNQMKYVVAPGANTGTTSGPSGYSYVNGTSFSAPTVAAAAALIKQAVPSATPTQIVNALFQTADSSAIYL